MVIIDAANYVYKCITTQARNHLNLGESNDVLLCIYVGFSFSQVKWPNLGGAFSSHQTITSFFVKNLSSTWSVTQAMIHCPVSNNSFGSIWFSMVLVGHGFINCLPSESFVVSFS